MKIGSILLCSTVLAVTVLAQAPATKAPPKKAGAEKSAKKEEEPPPKIDGVEIQRGEAGFLGLQIVDANFRLSFYDKKKKPIPVDVTQAVLRWQPTYQKAEERVLLERSGDGKFLTSSRVIRPPHSFKLSIVLFKSPAPDAEAVATENFVIDFAQ